MTLFSKNGSTDPKNELKGNQTIHYHLLRKGKYGHLYKTIFIAFSFIFFIFSAFIFFKTPNWNCSLYFSNCGLMKTVITSASFLMSLGAFALACTIRPEHDIADDLAVFFKKSLLQVYQHVAVNHSELSTIQSFYHETLEQIEMKKYKTIQKIELIKQASYLDLKAKKRLFNLVFNELQSKLNAAHTHFHDRVLFLKLPKTSKNEPLDETHLFPINLRKQLT